MVGLDASYQSLVELGICIIIALLATIAVIVSRMVVSDRANKRNAESLATDNRAFNIIKSQYGDLRFRYKTLIQRYRELSSIYQITARERDLLATYVAEIVQERGIENADVKAYVRDEVLRIHADSVPVGEDD